MNHKNIIIAVDCTEEADQIVKAAKELAPHGATLTLMTVIKPVAYAYGPDQAIAMASIMDLEEEATKAARGSLDSLAKKYEINGDQLVLLGPPAGEIRRRAEATNADLIVIGSHSRHGLGLLLGSTANGVLHGATCDVFVVNIK